MKARQLILALIGLAIVYGAYMGSKAMVRSKKPQARKEAPASVKTVSTFKVANGDVQSTIPITGKLVAENRTELYAEVAGMLKTQSKVFKEGNSFKKGEVLLRIDDSEYRMSILSQKSALLNTFTQLLPDLKIDFPNSFEKWNNYLKDFSIEGALPALPEVTDEKEKFYLASRNIFGQYYNIKSMEERLSKYVIKAPFDGVVVTSQIDPGTNVRVGQSLGEFIDPTTYELEAAVGLKDIELISTGDVVILNSPDVAGEWTGKIKRVSNKIDDATQTVRVFVSVTGKGLKEGMYLTGSIESELVPEAMEIDRKLLVTSSEVYIVDDGALRLKTVEVIKFGTGTAIVKGLPEGADLLDGTIVGAYSGMPVRKAGAK